MRKRERDRCIIQRTHITLIWTKVSVTPHFKPLFHARARIYIYIILNVLRVLRGDDDDERLPLDLFHRLRCRFGDCDCAFRRSFSAQNHHQFSPSFERDDDDDDDDEGGSGGGG